VLNGLLKHVPGISLKQRIDVTLDFEKDHKALVEMTGANADKINPMVLLLQEAWLPPITESLLYLRKLRELLGNKAVICIFLIGKPSSDHGFTPVAARDWRIWKQAIGKLSDPFIEINGVKNS